MGWFIAMLVCLVAGIGIGVLVGSGRPSSGYNSPGHPASPGLGFGVGIVAVVVLCLVVSIPFSVRIIAPGESGVRMAFGSFAGDPSPTARTSWAPGSRSSSTTQIIGQGVIRKEGSSHQEMV